MTSTDRVSPRIRECVADGRITWTGPLVLLVGRSAFMFVAQAIFALVFMLNGDPSPWRAAAPYWTVYGTLVDLGCLTLMWRFTRTEGTTIRGLIGTIRWRRARDLFARLGLFFLDISGLCGRRSSLRLATLRNVSCGPGPRHSFRARPPCMGHLLQLSFVVDDLVADGRNHLSRLCFTAHRSAYRTHLDCCCYSRILVGAST